MIYEHALYKLTLLDGRLIATVHVVAAHVEQAIEKTKAALRNDPHWARSKGFLDPQKAVVKSCELISMVEVS
jgi:hypothetical protein